MIKITKRYNIWLVVSRGLLIRRMSSNISRLYTKNVNGHLQFLNFNKRWYELGSLNTRDIGPSYGHQKTGNLMIATRVRSRTFGISYQTEKGKEDTLE